MPIHVMETVFVNDRMKQNTYACVNWGLLDPIVNTRVNHDSNYNFLLKFDM